MVARLLIATALIASGALAGCGSAATTEPVSDFRIDADPLCTKAKVREEAARREIGAQLTVADRALLLGELAPIRFNLAADLAKLEAPEGAAEEASRLVALAGQRGEASAEAARRHAAGAAERRIARAAAEEHQARLRFVAVARRLDLEQCAERLSPDALEEVEEAVAVLLSDPAASERCAAHSSRYLLERYGGEARCRAEQRRAGPAGPAELTDAQGIPDVFAVARAAVEREEGTRSGEYRLRLTFERGRYRLDGLTERESARGPASER